MTTFGTPARRLDALQYLLRWLMIAVAIAGLLTPARARADLLQCPYPDTYFFFDVIPGLGNIRGFVCDSPIEENGSHRHAEYGGGGLTVNLGANASIPGLQGVNGSTAQAGVAVTLASGTYVCNDQRYESAPPNVYQTWNKIRPEPRKCIPIRVHPTAIGAPWPPVTDVNLVVKWPPEAPPEPHGDYPGGPGPVVPPPPPIPPAPPADPGILPPTVLSGGE